MSLANLNRFPDRAVNACVDAMRRGKLSPRHISDVLKYKGVDVTPIEEFLNDSDPMIRTAAVQIIGKLGNKDKIIDLLKTEENKRVMMVAIGMLTGKTDLKRMEEVVNLLNAENPIVRNEAIEMFRKSGRADCLTALLFDDDDSLVNRVKRYLEDEDKNVDGKDNEEKE